MHLGKVIGRVIATIKDPTLEGIKLLVVQPLDHHQEPIDKTLIAADGTAQAGIGEIIHYVTGREGSIALPLSPNPTDAVIVSIVDEVHITD